MDERLAGKVFLVPGLLAHQHEVRALASRSRPRMAGVLVGADSACIRSRLWQARAATRSPGRHRLELKLIRHLDARSVGPSLGINAGPAPVVRRNARLAPPGHKDIFIS